MAGAGALAKPPSSLIFFLGFALWVDRVPWVPSAYVAPLSVFVASALLPFLLPRLFRIQVGLPSTIAMTLALWLTSWGAFLLIRDGYALSFLPWEVRLEAYTRQVITLWSGLMLFFVVATLVPSPRERQTLLWGASWGGAISAGIGLLQRLGVPLEEKVRGLLGLPVFPGRAAGLAAEPAHFATFLVLFGVPLALLGALKKDRFHRIWGLGLLFVYGLNLFFSQSLVGFALLAVFVSAFVSLSLFIRGMNRSGILVFGLLIGLLVSGWLFEQISYARTQLESLLKGEPTVSFHDRFWGLAGGLNAWISDSQALFGYGLGGHGYRLEKILPKKVAQEVLQVKDEKFPALNSFFGRILADGGIVAAGLLSCLALYGLVRGYNLTKTKEHGIASLVFLPAWIATLAAVAVGGQGSLAAPSFWFWLALLSSWKERGPGLANSD